MMTTHGLKRRTRRGRAAAAAAVLGVGALTGCAPDIGGLLESAIEDAVNSEGGDIDIEFNDGGISIEGSENGEEFAIDLGAGGDSCAPGWVAVPQGDVIFAQRLVSGEGEVCVTGWMVAGTPDDVPRQNMEEIADGGELSSLATLMTGLLATQMEGTLGGAVGGALAGDLGDAADRLAAEGGELTVYGADGRVVIVIVSPGVDDSQTQVSMGITCEGGC